MSKSTLVFANWKMYLNIAESEKLAADLTKKAKSFPRGLSVAVFPSALAFAAVKNALAKSKIAVGAQNAYWVDKGGYTGEVSAEMFKQAGAEYVLVGHSERRHVFNESNHDVRQKLEAVLAAKITPVLCVGETREERDDGRTEEVLEIQLRSALDNLRLNGKKEIIIAYEPVWAIGTGEACSAAEAGKAQAYVAKLVKTILPSAEIKILYGGSVREKNVGGFLNQPHCDGLLVGGASAKLASLLAILDEATSFTA